MTELNTHVGRLINHLEHRGNLWIHDHVLVSHVLVMKRSASEHWRGSWTDTRNTLRWSYNFLATMTVVTMTISETSHPGL